MPPHHVVAAPATERCGAGHRSQDPLPPGVRAGKEPRPRPVLTANRALPIAKATKAQSKAITGVDHGDPSDIILRLAMMTPNPRQDWRCCWRRPRSTLKVTGSERVGLPGKMLAHGKAMPASPGSTPMMPTTLSRNGLIATRHEGRAWISAQSPKKRPTPDRINLTTRVRAKCLSKSARPR